MHKNKLKFACLESVAHATGLQMQSTKLLK